MKYNKVLSVLFFLASLGIFLGYTFFYNSKGDKVPPMIHVPEEVLECSIETTEEELLQGITASDDQDGDLTDKIFVESLSNFIEENTRVLTVAVLDQAGNCAKGKRTIVYNDYTSPKFSMNKPLVFYNGEINITEFIHATDVFDGNLSAKISPSSAYHLNYQSGDYPMEFVVSNSVGDISRFTATVTLRDFFTEENTADIQLSEYLVYTEKGKKISPWSLVKGLTMNGHDYVKRDKQLFPDEESNYYWDAYPAVISKEDFKISSAVDYDTPGCYEVEYSYKHDTYSGKVRLVVVVE